MNTYILLYQRTNIDRLHIVKLHDTYVPFVKDYDKDILYVQVILGEDRLYRALRYQGVSEEEFDGMVNLFATGFEMVTMTGSEPGEENNFVITEAH